MTNIPKTTAAKPAPQRAARPAPQRAAKPFGRRLTDITGKRPLTTAETELIEACRMGRVATFGDKPPETATDGNTIHADLLRFLILGGDDETPVHEQGVQVQGAWIAGEVDLSNAEIEANIRCWACHFTGDLIARHARLHGLNLDDSQLQSLVGAGLVTNGSVFLRKIQTNNAVRLQGAHIGGNLECDGSKFLFSRGDALNCGRMVVEGSVFLRKSKFKGAVWLLGAKIGGNLECDDSDFLKVSEEAFHCDSISVTGSVFFRKSKFAGAVLLVRAQIGGNFECDSGKFLYMGGRALVCQGMNVKGGFLLRGGTKISGALSLSSAQVGDLIDEPDCWPAYGKLILDGFRYDRFGGATPTTDRRGDWLMRQIPEHLGRSFRPQPWRQAIKVLREMGHDGEARALAIRFNDLRYRQIRLGPLRQMAHWLHGRLFGYGLRPVYALTVHVGIALAFGLFYHFAATQGVFAPSNPLVFQNPDYAHCSPDYDPARSGSETAKIGNWYWCPAVPAEYTTFQPYWYSLDVILPVIDLQQEKDWGPMIDTPEAHRSRHWANNLFRNWHNLADFETNGLRFLTRLMIWIESLYGWVAGVVFVSMLTGIGRKDD